MLRARACFAAPNKDARAAGEYFEIAEKMGQALLHETGSWPLPLHASARLLWLRNQHPELFSRVHTVFGMGEWLNFKLSGVRAVDASLASATGLFRLSEKEWCWSIIDELALPREIFPSVIDAGLPIDTLTAVAADHLRLNEGLTVAMGGADTQCSFTGRGRY